MQRAGLSQTRVPVRASVPSNDRMHHAGPRPVQSGVSSCARVRAAQGLRHASHSVLFRS